MRKTIAFILTAALLLPALVIAPFFAVHTHAATVYAVGDPGEIFADEPSSGAEAPQGSEPAGSKPDGVLPIILIAVGAAAAGAASVAIPVAIKKRKGK